MGKVRTVDARMGKAKDSAAGVVRTVDARMGKGWRRHYTEDIQRAIYMAEIVNVARTVAATGGEMTAVDVVAIATEVDRVRSR